MERLGALWQGLDTRRRVMLLGAVAISVALLVALVQGSTSQRMALLYSGLDTATAGEVVGALEQMQVPSEVRGDAIFVPADARDRVRLALARDGIPRQGQAGYELLDQISGFSATTDMFNAAYWRAKEGELARTILASTGVRAARVHIAAPSRRPFARQGAEPSASVTVTMAGGALTAQQAMAFRYLVALSVANLDPEQVAVLDSGAGMVLAPGSANPASDALDPATARADKIKRELEEMLEARVGRDKVRVRVALETEREGETVTEKIIQPDSRVTIHAETEEIADTASGTNPSVTVASNLPDGDAAAQNESESNRTESRERVNYDYSEVRRERTRTPGAIKRLSVAVLVDGITAVDPDGNLAWTPRDAEELSTLRELVVAAVGFDEARGDIVTVESMAFQANEGAGELVEDAPLDDFIENNGLAVVQALVLGAVIIVLALTVLRPLLAPRPNDPPLAEAPALLGESPETQSALTARDAAGMESDDGHDHDDDRVLGIPDRESLLRVANERPLETIALLREWLEVADEEAA